MRHVHPLSLSGTPELCPKHRKKNRDAFAPEPSLASSDPQAHGQVHSINTHNNNGKSNSKKSNEIMIANKVIIVIVTILVIVLAIAIAGFL